MGIATQNPVESHGAYPLPEAQLDRFAMKLKIGYTNSEDEVAMMGQFVGEAFSNQVIQPVLTLEELSQVQAEVALVEVCESVRRYLVELKRDARRARRPRSASNAPCRRRRYGRPRTRRARAPPPSTRPVPASAEQMVAGASVTAKV